MTSDEKDLALDRLLSGGGLSGIEEADILSNVFKELKLGQTSAAPEVNLQTEGKPFWSKLSALFLPIGAIATAALIFIIMPEEKDVEFNERGVGVVDAQDFAPAISCGVGAPCSGGSEMLFSATLPDGGFVSAAVKNQAGESTWLFLNEKAAPALRMDYEVQIPSDFSVGTYELRVFVTTMLASQDVLETSEDSLRYKADWTVR